ncbi:MAG: cysteine desulfurase-like protein [Pirellulales bacterium]
MNQPQPTAAKFDVQACRQKFPALGRTHNGQPAVYFDGPAGSQVPESVIEAMADYMRNANANHGGVFATSRESDAMLAEAHRAAADFVGTDDASCVAFGVNMTTLVLALSRALARTWKQGDEVMVTRLDHDANVSPWVLAAEDAGAVVRHVDVHREDCTLDMEDFQRKLSDRTRMVAVGCASNATGTINPVAEICRLAHAAGAEVCLDAVHYAPHRLIDVAAWDCDFLLCSAYKFFGPHVGLLWGKKARMAELPVYKVRPASNNLPDRWMTGTQSHEGIAGVVAAIEYLADLGRSTTGKELSRRQALVAAFEAIEIHERTLLTALLAGLSEMPEITVWGIRDPQRFDQRVPTLGVTHSRVNPEELAQHLADRGIFVWHGNFYALPLTETLGLEPQGMVRIGLLHYNDASEVQRLLDALREL